MLFWEIIFTRFNQSHHSHQKQNAQHNYGYLFAFRCTVCGAFFLLRSCYVFISLWLDSTTIKIPSMSLLFMCIPHSTSFESQRKREKTHTPNAIYTLELKKLVRDKKFAFLAQTALNSVWERENVCWIRLLSQQNKFASHMCVSYTHELDPFIDFYGVFSVSISAHLIEMVCSTAQRTAWQKYQAKKSTSFQ